MPSNRPLARDVAVSALLREERPKALTGFSCGRGRDRTNRQSRLPDPLEPGRFSLHHFDEKARYDSRWASHQSVVDRVLEGRYDLLTPIVSEFIPTLRCPYRCPTCAYRKPKEDAGVWEGNGTPNTTVEMSVDQARRYLDKLKRGGCQAVLLTGGGEPTWHPHLGEIARHAKALGLRLGMSTNGTFAGGGFEPEDVIELGFDVLRVSLDTIEKHASFHGYDRSKTDWCRIVLRNIERVARANEASHSASTEVTICILFDHRNYEELPELAERLVQFGCIRRVVIRPVMDYFGKGQVRRSIVRRAVQLTKEKVQPLLSTQGVDVVLPEEVRVVLSSAERAYSQCRASGLIGGVWPDGRVFICTETSGLDLFAIGDLSEQSLEQIYAGYTYRSVRSRVAGRHFHCCPVTCRPSRLNRIFAKMDSLRMKGATGLLERWVQALQDQHHEPNPWIEI